METTEITEGGLRLDNRSIEFRQIVGIIGTSAGTAIILRDGSSILSPADVFTISDGCPWACCSV